METVFFSDSIWAINWLLLNLTLFFSLSVLALVTAGIFGVVVTVSILRTINTFRAIKRN